MIGILSTMSKVFSLIAIGLATDGTTFFFGHSIGAISSLAGTQFNSNNNVIDLKSINLYHL